jgi:hypothetical protein
MFSFDWELKLGILDIEIVYLKKVGSIPIR